MKDHISLDLIPFWRECKNLLIKGHLYQQKFVWGKNKGWNSLIVNFFDVEPQSSIKNMHFKIFGTDIKIRDRVLNLKRIKDGTTI